ncbi:MAG: RHS repeat-associated core domain-containing protein, partial [Planctomycetota bacterium]
GRIALVDVGTGSMYYFLNDRLGTPQMLTNSSNTVVWEGIYKPFGEADVNTNSSVKNNFRFPGQYYDQETGLHYNYHRYYDPSTGRYLTPDPIGLAGGINLFLYADGNPINEVDRLGLIVEADPFNPIPNLPTSNLTKGEKTALFKTGLGAGLIIGGSLTLPEGAPFIAVGIPMLAEGLTLDVAEFVFHGDTSNIPSTWEVFGTVAEQIYRLNDPCE